MKHALCLCAIIILISGRCAIGSMEITKGNPSLYLSNAPNVNSDILSKYPLITWLRKSPVEISCMLESQLGYKDPVFNCARKNYVNKGDPCKKTKEYYEGLQIPDNLAPKIHPLFKTITLAFEHGNLQMVTIEFNDSIAIDQIKELFNLPSERSKFPDNIMYIRYGENVSASNKPTDPKYTRWLEIVGFDHLGAGDVDCK
jgi:hypothetical protein